MKKLSALQCALVALTSFLISSSSVTAQESPTVAQCLPATTVVYAEAKDPAALIDAVWNHPLRERVEALPQIKEAMQGPQMIAVNMAQSFVENQLGASVEETLKSITAKGFYFAFDAKSNGVIVVFRAADEAKLKKTAETVLNLTQFLAQQSGGNKPYTIKEFNNAKIADFKQFVMSRSDDWFLLSNQSQLLESVLDRMNGRSGDSLSEAKWFVDAQTTNRTQSAWAAINLDFARKMNPAAFQGKTDNPGIELLAGGVLDSLKNANHVAMNLDVASNLSLDISLPFQQDWMSETREFFFGSNGDGNAPTMQLPENTIANFSTHRDIGQWWLTKEDLFPESVIAGLAQFDSQVSTILAGLDFGEEFLGSLEPEMQLVVTEQKYEEEPDIQIPAMAIVAKLKEGAQIQRRLSVAYQNAISIFNLNASMSGSPPLETITERLDGIRVTSAEYMLEGEVESGSLLYNFSPSIAFNDNVVVISSTRKLAVDLAQGTGIDQKDTSGANTALFVDGKSLQAILQANKEPLIANQMLEDGLTRAESETQIGIILDLLGLLRSIEMDYSVQDKLMQLRVDVEFTE